MIRIKCMSAGWLVIAAAVMSPNAALAQQVPGTPPDRQPQGLFRGDQRDTQSRQALLLTASLFGVYDNNLIGIDSPNLLTNAGTQPGQRTKGAYSTANSGLFYARRTSRIEFGTTGTATFSYYPDLHRSNPPVPQPIDTYYGSTELNVTMGRSQFRTMETVSSMPYFALQAIPTGWTAFTSPLGPDTVLGFSPEVALLDHRAVAYSTSASFMTPLGRRSSFEAHYGYQGNVYDGRLTNVASQSGQLQLNHSVSRHGRVHGSYAYRLASYNTPLLPKADVTSHAVDAGYGMTRPLSRTRTFGFDIGAGATRLDDAQLLQQTGYTGVKQDNQMSAYLMLSLQFARTWSAQGDYRRSLQVLQGFAQPYYGDAVSAGVHGELSRRMDATVTGRFSQGNLHATLNMNGYNSRTAALRLRYALSRELALSGEYAYSQYDFGQNASLPVGLANNLSRHAVRVGLTFGTPLMGHQTRQ